MRIPKPLLITLFFLWFVSFNAFSQCKTIKVKTKITDTTNGQGNGVVELDVTGNSGKELSINLFGPRRNNRLGISDFVIGDLEKGKYLIVVSPKEEGSDLCPVSINVTIN